jgi:hypothetical protein
MFRRNRWKVVSRVFAIVLLSVVPGAAQAVLLASASPKAGFSSVSDTPDSSYTYASLKIPAVSAKTLAGRPITLPAPGRLTLLVGSVNGDRDQAASDWWTQASELCARHAVLDCYQAVEPSRKLRQAVPIEIRDRVAVVAARAQPWKSALQAASGANVYALLLAPDGTPLWHAAGRAGETMPAANLDDLLLAGNY